MYKRTGGQEKVMSARQCDLLILKLFITAGFFLGCISSICPAQEQNSGIGQLRIEGERIERLVLKRNDGNTEQFDNPHESIKLPVGEYKIQDIRLNGGYSIRNPGALSHNRVTVSEDEPVTLKAGAPLKQTVKIKRQGPVLMLSYELIGMGGESYVIARNKQPSFKILKGDKEIASGKFEFG